MPHNALTKKKLLTLRKLGLLLFQLHLFQFLELIVPYKHSRMEEFIIKNHFGKSYKYPTDDIYWCRGLVVLCKMALKTCLTIKAASEY